MNHPIVMEVEHWRPVVGNARYEVSSTGRVRSVWFHKKPRALPRLLAPVADSDGYTVASLSDGSRASARLRKVHRLVLEAFVGPCPEGMQACHGNGVRSDNRLSNLRWDTITMNARDRDAHGTSPKRERNPRAKLSESDVLQIRTHRRWLPGRNLAEAFGVTTTQISVIQLGRQWR